MEDVKLCPLLGVDQNGVDRACRGERCSLWIKTDGDGSCAVAMIAEDLRSAGTNADLIAEGVAEIGNEMPSITKAVKGLV